MDCGVKILDCTLRDGGYINNWHFSREQARDTYAAATHCGLAYCEVGFRRSPMDTIPNKYGPWYVSSESILQDTFSDIAQKSCTIAVMAQVGTFTLEDFPPRDKSLVGMIRLLISDVLVPAAENKLELHVPDIVHGLELASALHKKGYEVALNIPRVDKLTSSQIQSICQLIQGAPIAFLYLADTYGNLGIQKTQKILSTFTANYSGPLGFHAHDNLQNASVKSIDALYHGAKIVDVCFGGFGRGSGNAKAELVIAHMIMGDSTKYDLLPALVYVDRYILPYRKTNLLYLITGMYSMHVSYAIELLENETKLDVKQAYNVLMNILRDNHHHFFSKETLAKEIEVQISSRLG